MKPLFALAVLLAIAGCHRHATADVTLGADADARNAAQAKINADLAAADAAARAPIPSATARLAPARTDHAPPAPAEAAQDGADLESNSGT